MNRNEREAIEKVTQYLKKLEIPFTLHRHPPVFTVEEAKKYWQGINGAHCKNLFLRNKKGNRHYLVIAPIDCRVDLRKLTHRLGEDRLSFASSQRLERYLGLSPGAVSPFGLLNDQAKEVRVIIDQSLQEANYVNFHPNTNTATLNLRWTDFYKFLQNLNYQPLFVNLGGRTAPTS